MTNTKQLPDAHARQAIIQELGTTMLVEAAAGTGKTTSMVGRLIAMLATGHCRAGEVAAITFTRKAAAEMRERFRRDLAKAAAGAVDETRENLRAALAEQDRCFIGTIHSFCARLLRERPVEAGVDPAFIAIEQDADDNLRRQAWHDWTQDIYDSADPIIDRLAAADLKLADLRDGYDQMATFCDVVDWPAPEVDLPQVDSIRGALREYAEHMRALVPSFPVDRGKDKLMGLYDDMARHIGNAPLDSPVSVSRVLDQWKSNPYVTQGKWPDGRPQGKQERDRWKSFTEEWVTPWLNQWYAWRYPIALETIRSAVAHYTQKRAGLGMMNYGDLLMGAAALLRDGGENVRRYFAKRFRCLLVDEFQDTDPIQAEVMMLLTADDATATNWHNCRPRPGSLFVVGDPKQSIYRFRRADIVTYNEVRDIITASGGRVVNLSANFRSTEPVINWANVSMTGMFTPADVAGGFSPEYVALEAGRQTPATDATPTVSVSVRAIDKSRTVEIRREAELLARHIRHALDTEQPIHVPGAAAARPVCPGDFMLLMAKKKYVHVYAQALGALGISHEVTGGRVLNDTPALRILHLCLAAVVNPQDPVALVALLRSELFGIDDATLYALRKAAGPGGQPFDYRAALPDAVPGDVRAAVEPVVQRLRRYARLFVNLPAVAAVESICRDLGLPAWAAASQVGNVDAGSLAKAIELMRGARGQYWSPVDLVAFLGDMVNGVCVYDGLPAREYAERPVRIMNLHKAKGLEAPIVFLADPSKPWNPKPQIHVDRQGGAVCGYMLVGRKVGYQVKSLARHADWDEFSRRESRFGDAERERLLYVAATRAGVQVAVARGEKYGEAVWQRLIAEDAPDMPDPGPQTAPAIQGKPVHVEESAAGADEIRRRWSDVGRPTHKVAAAKALALADSPHVSPGEYGTEWGTAVHTLLEAAMEDPPRDLRELARAALENAGLAADRLDMLLATVRSVTASPLWHRARASEQCLVEVPIRITEPGDVPTLARGVIDLAFREPDGWVIVDYKSDSIGPDGPDALVRHYAPQVATYARLWSCCTGATVKEQGLYFTDAGEYVVCE